MFQLSSPNKQNGAINNAIIYMTAMLVPMTSHDLKSQVSPHFDHCDLINAMVLLATALASQRYVLTLSIHVSIHCVDTSRQCLDMTKHFLDI